MNSNVEIQRYCSVDRWAIFKMPSIPAYSNYSIEDTALLFVPIKERINIMNKSEPNPR
jgi:hypothetical protein